MMSYPNPDIEKETVFPPCHCEHLKGACLHAVAAGFGTQAWQSDEVVARAQPVAISSKKTGLLRFARNDDPLNRDLGVMR